MFIQSEKSNDDLIQRDLARIEQAPHGNSRPVSGMRELETDEMRAVSGGVGPGGAVLGAVVGGVGAAAAGGNAGQIAGAALLGGVGGFFGAIALGGFGGAVTGMFGAKSVLVGGAAASLMTR